MQAHDRESCFCRVNYSSMFVPVLHRKKRQCDTSGTRTNSNSRASHRSIGSSGSVWAAPCSWCRRRVGPCRTSSSLPRVRSPLWTPSATTATGYWRRALVAAPAGSQMSWCSSRPLSNNHAGHLIWRLMLYCGVLYIMHLDIVFYILYIMQSFNMASRKWKHSCNIAIAVEQRMTTSEKRDLLNVSYVSSPKIPIFISPALPTHVRARADRPTCLSEVAMQSTPVSPPPMMTTFLSFAKTASGSEPLRPACRRCHVSRKLIAKWMPFSLLPANRIAPPPLKPD